MKKMLCALEAGNLSLFVGAGLSTLPPSCAPSWSDLRDLSLGAIVNFLNTSNCDSDTTTSLLNSKKVLPEVLFEGVDRFGGMSKIKNFVKTINSGQPNVGHHRIAALVKAGYLRHIVTTNWDTYLERALGESSPLHILPSREDYDDKIYQSQKINHSKRYLAHLHGSLEEEDIILANLYRIGFQIPYMLKSYLDFILRSTNLLVIGYSGSDWEISEAIQSALKNNDNCVFWINKPRAVLHSNLIDLRKAFPQKVFIIENDLFNLLMKICNELSINHKTPTEDSNPNFDHEFQYATKSLGHSSIYLVCGFLSSSIGDWSNASMQCEYAVDSIYSKSKKSDNYNHQISAECLRLAAGCSAFAGDFEYAHFLMREADTEIRQASIGIIQSMRYNVLKLFQSVIIEMCEQNFSRAIDTFKQMCVRLHILQNGTVFSGPDSVPLILHSAVTSAGAILNAITKDDIQDALKYNIAAYQIQKNTRNIWGKLFVLLSLAACYYRQGSFEDARLALGDCLNLSKSYGHYVVAEAVENNLKIVKGKKKNKLENSPIVDPHTGWRFVMDPFVIFLQPEDDD